EVVATVNGGTELATIGICAPPAVSYPPTPSHSPTAGQLSADTVATPDVAGAQSAGADSPVGSDQTPPPSTAVSGGASGWVGVPAVGCPPAAAQSPGSAQPTAPSP